MITSSSESVLGVIVTVYASSPSTPVFILAVARPVSMLSTWKSFTGSEKVMVMSKGSFFSMSGMSVIATVGGMVSICTMCSSDAVLLLSPLSCAAPTGTFIFTSSSESVLGVRVAVYSESPSVPVFILAVAGPVSVMSSAWKPFTGSEKVMVMSKGSFFSMSETLLITTVGGTSTVTVSSAEAVLSLFPVSCATFSGTLIVTVPSLVGVVVAI